MNLKQLSSVLLYLGVGVIMFALIYMIINLSEADKFINTWMMSMITGVLFITWSVISLFISKKITKK